MSTDTYESSYAERFYRRQEILKKMRACVNDNADVGHYAELQRQLAELKREQADADALEFGLKTKTAEYEAIRETIDRLEAEEAERDAEAKRSIRNAFCMAGAGLALAIGMIGYIVVKNA